MARGVILTGGSIPTRGWLAEANVVCGVLHAVIIYLSFQYLILWVCDILKSFNPMALRMLLHYIIFSSQSNMLTVMHIFCVKRQTHRLKIQPKKCTISSWIFPNFLGPQWSGGRAYPPHHIPSRRGSILSPLFHIFHPGCWQTPNHVVNELVTDSDWGPKWPWPFETVCPARAPAAVFFVRIDPICFLAGCRKRWLNQG